MVLIRSFQKDSSDKMPQTVPSAGFTPPDYSAFAADSFDLSLLPSSPESDIPLSPYTSPPSLFSSDSSSRILKPPQIYTTFYPNTPPLENQDDLLEENIKKTNIYSPYGTPFQNQNSTLLTILKEEPNSGQYLSPGFQHSAPISPPSSCVSYSNHSSPIYPQSVSPVNVQEGLEEFNIIQKSIQSGKYNQPLLSPVPQKSLDYIPNSFTTNSSNQSLYAGSPLTINIKHENTVDLQESLEEFKFLQKSLEDTYQSKQYQKYNDQYKDNYSYSPNNFQDNFSPQIHSPFQDQFALQLSPEYLQKVPEKLCLLEAKKENDHQLLREALRDTSFQEKYNLKPFEFGEIGTGFVGTIKMEEPDEAGRSNGGIEGHREDVLMTSCNEELDREKIEPVLSLAIAQMKKEADNICSVLGISPDPTRWSTENVKAWLTWTAGQLNLGPIHMDYFNIDGAALVALTEEQFIQRAPQCGSTLHARLEIWKAACSDENLGYSLQTVARTQTTTPAPVATVTTSGESSSSPAPPVVTPQIPTTWNAPGSSQSSNASSAGEASDDEDNESTAEVSTPSPVTTSPKATTSRGSTGSSHIHLWQFLKELLAAPTLYGSAIRWLDRGKGVFKIEDSVRVARLWGKRKNRPAMNYDKLSRSIRQYYKKGIMKKTERSQRLVYQFCHPYCL